MKPHKHAALIHAWADGARVEYKSYDGFWYPDNDETWEEDKEYRIRCEPSPDVVKYVEVYPEEITCMSLWQGDNDNLQLTWDGESGKLKKAEVL